MSYYLDSINQRRLKFDYHNQKGVTMKTMNCPPRLILPFVIILIIALLGIVGCSSPNNSSTSNSNPSNKSYFEDSDIIKPDSVINVNLKAESSTTHEFGNQTTKINSYVYGLKTGDAQESKLALQEYLNAIASDGYEINQVDDNTWQITEEGRVVLKITLKLDDTSKYQFQIDIYTS